MNVRAVIAAVVPRRLANRLARLRFVRALKNAVLGESDPEHLASGRLMYEGLDLTFTAPYQTWAKAKRVGVEARLCRLILVECRPGDLVVDVGANCGFLSMVMARAVDGGAVVAVEAAEDFYGILCRNISDNGLASSVSTIHAPAGDGTGSTVRIDDLLDRRWPGRPVRFMKVDVDGPDLDVLYGSERILRRDHPTLADEISTRQAETVEFLRAAGYRVVTDMSGRPVETGKWPPNVIASMRPVRIPRLGEAGARRAEAAGSAHQTGPPM